MPIEFWFAVGYILIGVLFMGITAGYDKEDPLLPIILFWPLLLAIDIVVGIVFGLYKAGECVGSWIEDLFN